MILSMFLGLFLIWTHGCSASKKASNNYSREIAQHTETMGETNVVTKVIEEEKDGVYTIRVVIIKDGKLRETVHSFESNNFKISIPVSANIMVQSNQETQKSTSTSILQFSQKLELAREFMMKTKYVEALEALNEALTIDSYNPQAHMMKGSILYAMGKEDLARKEFDYVLKVDPENAEVKRFKHFMESKKEETQKVKIETMTTE